MRNTYLNTLYELAKQDKNVLSLVADNGMIVYDDFKRDMPDQFFNFGISEGHMISAAAGLASCGKIPFIYTISAFLAYRSYEFLRLDVCLQNLNVKIVGIGTGTSYGYLGPTHHTTEDIALLRSLPNLTVFSPSTIEETKEIIKASYFINGPVYIRLGNNSLSYPMINKDFCIGKGNILSAGNDIAIFTTGSILEKVLKVESKLKVLNINAKIISIHTLKPFDCDLVEHIANSTKKIFSIEEHNCIGGLGSAIAEVIADRNLNTEFYRIGLKDIFAQGYGTQQEVRMQNNLDANGVYKQMIDILL